MEIRWTEEAAADLERITDFLFEHAPGRAADVGRTIYNAPAPLVKFPRLGRPGKKEGTRELVLSPFPYIIVYKVLDDAVQLVRILHGAPKWP